MKQHNTLWKKINSLQIEPPQADLTFTQRLARENDWSATFSEKVIFEYRRFLFLMATSNREVTPSDQVDQAWHLHLTYTRSYWQDLCEDIIGFKLHHNPTEGGVQQQEKFKEQYQYTLDLYKKVYNEAPLNDVWPSVEKRFDAFYNFTRISRKKFWVIQKPEFSIDKFLFFAFIPTLLTACTDDINTSDIWFWIKLALGLYVIYKVLTWLGFDSKGGNGRGGGGCGGGD